MEIQGILNAYHNNLYGLRSLYRQQGAGPAMAARYETESRQAAAASQNAQNMMSLQATKDGWMQNIHNMMGRMTELAVMANDGTKSPADRQALQFEFEQMQQEIQRITTGPNAAGKFNGLFLFQA